MDVGVWLVGVVESPVKYPVPIQKGIYCMCIHYVQQPHFQQDFCHTQERIYSFTSIFTFFHKTPHPMHWTVPWEQCSQIALLSKIERHRHDCEVLVLKVPLFLLEGDCLLSQRQSSSCWLKPLQPKAALRSWWSVTFTRFCDISFLQVNYVDTCFISFNNISQKEKHSTVYFVKSKFT